MKAFIYSLLLVLLMSFHTMQAQQEMGIHLMPRAYQSTWTNPAHLMPYKFNLSLPQFYVGATHTGFTYNDLITPVAGTDSFQLNVENALNSMGERNFVRFNTTVEVFSLSLRILKMQIMLGARVRGNSSFGYTKDIVQLGWYGNGAFIGDTLNLAPSFEAYSFSELSAGINVPIGDTWRVGGRVKYVVGLFDIQTTRNQLTLNTSDEYYQLGLGLDYGFNVGAPFDLVSIPNLDSLINNGLEVDEINIERDQIFPNRGLGVDLGVTFTPGKRWRFQASLLDIGYIQWNTAAKAYRVNGNLEFNGLSDALLPDSLSGGINSDDFLDSLTQDFRIYDSTLNYRTPLPTSFYLSGTYRFPFKLRLSVMGHGEQVLDKWRTAWAIGVSKDFGRVLSLGANYSVRNKLYNSVGANVVLRLGPTLFYVASDNVLAFAFPQTAQYTSVRMGMNLAIGRDKKYDKPKKKKKKDKS